MDEERTLQIEKAIRRRLDKEFDEDDIVKPPGWFGLDGAKDSALEKIDACLSDPTYNRVCLNECLRYIYYNLVARRHGQ